MSSKLYDKDGCLFNMDQWHNPHDGTGKPGVDGKTATKFINGRKITEKELNNIYTGDGLGARIINKASDDATSKWSRLFYGYVWDVKKQKLGEDKPIKGSDHTKDAERYNLYTNQHVNLYNF